MLSFLDLRDASQGSHDLCADLTCTHYTGEREGSQGHHTWFRSSSDTPVSPQKKASHSPRSCFHPLVQLWGNSTPVMLAVSSRPSQRRIEVEVGETTLSLNSPGETCVLLEKHWLLQEWSLGAVELEILPPT